MIKDLIFLLVGLVLVIKGADYLINGASSLAKRFKISEMVIGLTIVAFGTSAPELVVNIFSSLAKNNELVLGNVIGSNIFNTLLILGVAGLISPLTVQRNSVRKEIPFSFLITVLFFLLANDFFLFKNSTGTISRIDSFILLALFALFLYYTFGLSKIKTEESGEITLFSIPKTWFYVFLGFTGLFLGGKIVVDYAVVIARELNVSDKLIGLTIVSAGTSLPELATSAVAAFKKRSDLAVGNVIGSNIFNLLLIVGVSAQIYPIPYAPAFNVDLLIFGAATLFLFIAMFTFKSHSLDRWEALILFVSYIIYMVIVISRK